MTDMTMKKQFTSRCRRRLTPVISALMLVLMVQTGAEPTPSNGQAQVVPIDANVLRSNMRYWTTDYAVMFHVPRCLHCKYLFGPVWDLVTAELAFEDPKGKRKLVMASFDCEQDDAAAEFCEEMALPVFPSFAFFGQGTLHAHDPVTDVLTGSNRPVHPSCVMFPLNTEITDLVLTDWVNTMHFVSSSNGFMQKVNPFRRRSQSSQAAMEIDALEGENQRLREQLNRERPPVEGEEESAFGDAYRELSGANGGLVADALAWCILELSNEYCESFGVKWVDPFCSTVEMCVASLGQANNCFPPSCPLLHEGCNYVSQCLHPEYVQAYQEATADALGVANEEVPGAQSAGHFEGTHELQEASDAPPPPFLGRAASAGRSGGDKSTDELGDAMTA